MTQVQIATEQVVQKLKELGFFIENLSINDKQALLGYIHDVAHAGFNEAYSKMSNIKFDKFQFPNETHAPKRTQFTISEEKFTLRRGEEFSVKNI